MKDQDLKATLRRLTDEELRDLTTSELTEEGEEALRRELDRRESPDFAAERDRQATEWKHHEEVLERKREINRRAKGYAWVVVLVVLPIMIVIGFIGWSGSRSTESELTPAGERNRMLEEARRSQLPVEDQEVLSRMDEGQESARRTADLTLTFGGMAAVLWVISFLSVRLLLRSADSNRVRSRSAEPARGADG